MYNPQSDKNERLEKIVEDKLQILKIRLGEIQDLNRAAALLGWDQQT